MFFTNHNVFAGTDQTSKYNLEDLIAIRTDKIKDAMNDNIAKIVALHQEIDANPSAFLVLTHVNKDASKVLNYPNLT